MFKRLALSVISGALLVSVVNSAQALEFKIVPDSSHISKQDLERRITQLEYAVQELQMRVFNLQNENYHLKTQGQQQIGADKKWYCEVSAFMKNFSAFGRTKLEAKQQAERECSKKYSAMHCEDVKCQENE